MTPLRVKSDPEFTPAGTCVCIDKKKGKWNGYSRVIVRIKFQVSVGMSGKEVIEVLQANTLSPFVVPKSFVVTETVMRVSVRVSVGVSFIENKR